MADPPTVYSGGVASGRVCACSLRSRLVFNLSFSIFNSVYFLSVSFLCFLFRELLDYFLIQADFSRMTYLSEKLLPSLVNRGRKAAGQLPPGTNSQ